MMIVLLAACEADSPPGKPGSLSQPASSTAAPTTACATAQTKFGPTYKYEVLTAVAPAVTITSAAGGRLDTTLRPVRRYRAEVVTEGDVPQREVYRAFVDSFGDSGPAPALGEVATPIKPSTMTMGGPGRFVRFEGVVAVAATFSYSCGSTAGAGTVTSWLAPVSGALSCDRKPQPDEPIHRQAAALACPT